MYLACKPNILTLALLFQIKTEYLWKAWFSLTNRNAGMCVPANGRSEYREWCETGLLGNYWS